MPAVLPAAIDLLPNGPCVATALIPLYMHPGDKWKEVRNAHGSNRALSIVAIINDALLYHKWYGVDGIFFDEMANAAGHEHYYSRASAYAKSLSMRLTIGNPGTDTIPSYVGTVDSMVIYESRGYPPLSRFGGWHTSYPKSTWGSISYATQKLSIPKVCGLASVAGYIYVTDDTLPNPYDTLPPYFKSYINVL